MLQHHVTSISGSENMRAVDTKIVGQSEGSLLVSHAYYSISVREPYATHTTLPYSSLYTPGNGHMCRYLPHLGTVQSVSLEN